MHLLVLYHPLNQEVWLIGQGSAGNGSGLNPLPSQPECYYFHVNFASRPKSYNGRCVATDCIFDTNFIKRAFAWKKAAV